MLDTTTVAEQAAPATILTKAQTEERRRLKEWLESRIIAGAKKPSAEVVTLVPMLAQLLLERNHNNRPISKRNAEDLASDIANQRFQYNGQSISLSVTGVLLDGQHRCFQVSTTGIPIETVIAFGVKDDARFTIDTGRPKSVANFLAMKEYSYAKVLGPVAANYLQWRQKGYLAFGGNQRPTKAETLATADQFPDLEKSVEFTALTTKSPVRSHVILAFCHYVFWKRASREAADHFLSKLIDGHGLPKGDPILYCRNKLINMPSNSGGASGYLKAELIFRCWNAHRLNQTMDRCKLSGGKLINGKPAKLPKVER